MSRENFTINVTEGLGYADATLSGKFYSHDYGFVVIWMFNPDRRLHFSP